MQTKTAIILLLSIASSIVIVSILIIFIFRIIKIYNKRQFEFKEGLEILKLEKEKELLTTRIEVQEETFQIIGREIHDNINQLLTLSKLNLNSITFLESQETKIKIDNSAKLISDSIKGLTNLSRSLNTDLIKDVGITRILTEEINRVKTFHPIKLDFDFDKNVDSVDSELQLIIFRIAQESVRNAITHGHATYLLIRLFINDSHLKLVIKDDGAGFDTKKLSENKLSQGLKNIEKRVSLVNGNVKLNSKYGSGTELLITIPISLNK